MVGAMLRVLVISLLLLVGIMLVMTGVRRPLPAPEIATYFESPLPLPEFSLVDKTGEILTRESLRGRFNLMFFGFTNCPDICPLTLSVLADAKAELGRQPQTVPGVIFVSVDPDRDTPERIGAYLERFDASFAGVTGTEDSLRPLLSALGVSVQRLQLPGQPSYSVTHNGTIYVLGPQAELIATMSGSPTAAEIVTDFRRVRQLHIRRRTGTDAST
jgi:protein SCO1/2